MSSSAYVLGRGEPPPVLPPTYARAARPLAGARRSRRGFASGQALRRHRCPWAARSQRGAPAFSAPGPCARSRSAKPAARHRSCGRGIESSGQSRAVSPERFGARADRVVAARAKPEHVTGSGGRCRAPARSRWWPRAPSSLSSKQEASERRHGSAANGRVVEHRERVSRVAWSSAAAASDDASPNKSRSGERVGRGGEAYLGSSGAGPAGAGLAASGRGGQRGHQRIDQLPRSSGRSCRRRLEACCGGRMPRRLSRPSPTRARTRASARAHARSAPAGGRNAAPGRRAPLPPRASAPRGTARSSEDRGTWPALPGPSAGAEQAVRRSSRYEAAAPIIAARRTTDAERPTPGRSQA